MARKDQISLQSVPFFQENGPWEHRFCLRVASFWNFELGVSISLKKCTVFELQDAKTLESGIVFDVSGEPRAASGSFGEPRRTVDDDDDSPGYHHPPTPSRPGKKYVVRPGSSLRYR